MQALCLGTIRRFGGDGNRFEPGKNEHSQPFAGIVAGLLIGFVWEWLREHKHRAEAVRKQAEVRKLERELRRAQTERDKDKDEVLALLDQAS